MDARTVDLPQTNARKRRSAPIPRRALISSAAAAMVFGAGAAWLSLPHAVEKTDNAFTAADTTTAAPKVRGFVAEVLVRDNQAVRRGDPLVRINSEEFDARVAAAEGDLMNARATAAAAKAALISLDAEEKLALANVEATRTSIRSAKAEADRATAERRRYEALLAEGFATRSNVDRVVAAAITADQNRLQSEALLVVAEERARVTAARRGELEAALAKAEAQILSAGAALDLAEQDQRHATIVAPIDGVVGDRTVRVGDFVQPGTRLLSLIPVQSLYVTANFKETQTARMRSGQLVTIKVDGAPGKTFEGTVDSLAPGSASTFSLLPFEPGTGNFTKIVQRVPVRIRFVSGQRGLSDLRPGLSVTAKVNTAARAHAAKTSTEG